MPKTFVLSSKIAWSKWAGLDINVEGKEKGSQNQLYLSGGREILDMWLDAISLLSF